MIERLGRCVVSVACVLALAASCAGPGGGTEMTVEAPPEGWLQDLADEREAKDAQYRVPRESPIPPHLLASFDGLDYFDPEPDLRFVGELQVYPESEPFDIITTTGKVRPCVRHGWLTFRVDGQRLNLQVYKLLDGLTTDDPLRDLFVPFTDATTGVETYPAGRYIDLEDAGDGRVVLDFNRAYNPLCAYGMPERYACPVTPAENRLPVRIEAGEIGFAGDHG